MDQSSTRMLAKLISPLKEFGPFAGVLYIIDRLLLRLRSPLRLYCYEFMVQPIVDRPLGPRGLVKWVEIREIPRGDPLLERMPTPRDVIESRYDQPTVCLGAFLNQQMIAYLWLCFGAYQEDEVRCTFVLSPETKAVFDFDVYVFPEHRGGLGFIAIWDGANRYLYDRGVRYSYSRLTRYNVASRTAHNHFGWKRVGSAVFLNGNRFQLMLATTRPFISASFGVSDGPRIALKPDVLGLPGESNK